MSFLKKRRLMMDLSQYQLAALSGVGQSRICQAEHENITLNALEKDALARVLQVPAVELFSPSGERELYRLLKGRISLEEKAQLLDVDHDRDLYLERLLELARKYGVEV